MIGRVTIDGDEFAPRAKSGFDRSRRLGKLGWSKGYIALNDVMES